MSSRMLLKGGTVLTHDEYDHVVPIESDLLIEGNIIIKMAKNIDADMSDSVIDCTNKILSPGFIDTHHHLWQTQLKGRHGNESLLDYIYNGAMMSHKFTPSDVFWGQLSGAMEAIDSGTTTVVDFSHVLYSPKHGMEISDAQSKPIYQIRIVVPTDIPKATSAISATVSSGLRSFYCYCPTNVVKSFNPKLEVDMDFLPEWLWAQLVELSSAQPFGNGRVQLGFAFDGYFAPKDLVKKLFSLVRSSGIKLITSHYVKGAILGSRSVVDVMESYGILGPDILIAHATQATAEDAEKLVKAKAHISSTPETELQMALGEPVCFRPDLEGVSSLGVDCHTTNSPSIFGQMRLALQNARGTRNQRIVDAGKFPDRISPSIEEVFNLGTIKGARAIRLDTEVGSLAVGKKADIVIFNGMSPGMVCAAQHDPLSAIVLHASVRDIDKVIIDGQIRKKDGTLTSVLVEDISVDQGNIITWEDVAKEVLRSRSEIQERIHKTDFSQTRDEVITMFQIDRAALSE